MRRLRWRKGQVLCLYPVVVLGILAVAALAIDVGNLCVESACLQNGADAASLASLLELWKQRGLTANSDEQACRNAGAAEAAAFVDHNAAGAGAGVVFGVWDGSAFTPVDHTAAANAVRVRAFRAADAPGGQIPTVFGGLLGIRDADEQTSATARFRHPGLMPFAVKESAVGVPGTALVMYSDTLAAPGNCGLLDYNGGENSAADISAWTSGGYDGWFYIDPTIGYLDVEGTTGLKSMVVKPLDTHISVGDELVICLYSSVTGVGAGAIFRVIGYAGVRVTGYTLSKTGEIASVGATVLSKYIVATGETEGPMANFMSLQLVE
jgi:hypothetical protein